MAWIGGSIFAFLKDKMLGIAVFFMIPVALVFIFLITMIIVMVNQKPVESSRRGDSSLYALDSSLQRAV